MCHILWPWWLFSFFSDSTHEETRLLAPNYSGSWKLVQLQHLESTAPTVCRIWLFASDTNCGSKDIKTGKDLEKIVYIFISFTDEKLNGFIWSARVAQPEVNNSELSTADTCQILSVLHIYSLNLMTTLWGRLLSTHLKISFYTSKLRHWEVR